MILDARFHSDARRYSVFNAKTCAMEKNVVWVDDETAKWSRYVMPLIEDARGEL